VPPNTAPPGSANVTLAIVQPQWARPQANENLLQLSARLKNDFLALVTARGYTARGPFSSWQAMVYPDKTGSDLVLIPELQIDCSYQNLQQANKAVTLFAKGNAYTYTLNGTATVRGQMNLVLTESMTNERMWAKSIPIDPLQVAWVGEKRFNSAQGAAPTTLTIDALIDDDPGFQRAVYPRLEEMYKQLLQASWDYLDPREVATVKVQAAKLKK
jgi:hypothetical protein